MAAERACRPLARAGRILSAGIAPMANELCFTLPTAASGQGAILEPRPALPCCGSLAGSALAYSPMAPVQRAGRGDARESDWWGTARGGPQGALAGLGRAVHGGAAGRCGAWSGGLPAPLSPGPVPKVAERVPRWRAQSTSQPCPPRSAAPAPQPCGPRCAAAAGARPRGSMHRWRRAARKHAPPAPGRAEARTAGAGPRGSMRRRRQAARKHAPPAPRAPPPT